MPNGYNFILCHIFHGVMVFSRPMDEICLFLFWECMCLICGIGASYSVSNSRMILIYGEVYFHSRLAVDDKLILDVEVELYGVA
jgi:hypothetical protein